MTDLDGALHHVGALARRRGLVVIISDFRVEAGWEPNLRVLANRHDVLAVEVIDPIELELPNVGLLPVRDPATGEMREIPTHKRRVRDEYAAAADARRQALSETFRSAGVDHLVLRTDHEWLDDLVRFLAIRRRRLAALSGGRT